MFRVIQVHKTTIRKWFEIMSYKTADLFTSFTGFSNRNLLVSAWMKSISQVTDHSWRLSVNMGVLTRRPVLTQVYSGRFKVNDGTLRWASTLINDRSLLIWPKNIKSITARIFDQKLIHCIGCLLERIRSKEQLLAVQFIFLNLKRLQTEDEWNRCSITWLEQHPQLVPQEFYTRIISLVSSETQSPPFILKFFNLGLQD